MKTAEAEHNLNMYAGNDRVERVRGDHGMVSCRWSDPEPIYQGRSQRR